MPPLRTRIRQVAEQTKVPQTVVEKDDALSDVLAGIAAQPELADTLVFQGGPALKKLVFGDDRCSEDLDCSALDAPRPERWEEVFRHAMAAAERLLRAQGPFTLAVARYGEHDPHPGGQQAFAVRVQFPWQPRPLCRIMVEITHDEPVLLAPEPRADPRVWGGPLRPGVVLPSRGNGSGEDADAAPPEECAPWRAVSVPGRLLSRGAGGGGPHALEPQPRTLCVPPAGLRRGAGGPKVAAY